MAVAVVEDGDEVGDVGMGLAVDGVRDGEAQALVLHVAHHLRHLLQGLGHALFPGVGVGGDVGDVALLGAGRPAGPGGVEVHVPGRAHRVPGPEHGPQTLLATLMADDPEVDAVHGVIGVLGKRQQLGEDGP